MVLTDDNTQLRVLFLKKYKSKIMKYLNLILTFLTVTLLFSACTKDEDINLDTNGNPTTGQETTCKIDRVYLDGAIYEEFIYDGDRVLRKNEFDENGVVDWYQTYGYDSEDRIVVVNNFNEDGDKSSFSEYAYNQEGLISERKWYYVENGENEYISQHLYSHHNSSDCSIEAKRRYDNDGVLSWRKEYEYFGDNCSYFERNYSGNPESIDYTKTYEFDGMRPYNEAINLKEGYPKFNITKFENRSSSGTITHQRDYEYEYNEHDYPIKATITQEDGNVSIMEYEYTCN